MTLDPAEQERLRSVPLPMNNLYSPLGMLAAVAAYTDGDPGWPTSSSGSTSSAPCSASCSPSDLPLARMRPLEATYLPWLDLRAYGIDDLFEPAARAAASRWRRARTSSPGCPGTCGSTPRPRRPG